MCGIAGIVDPKLSLSERKKSVNRMTDMLVHRGPDDSGCWLDTSSAVSLGHRRLSILDLSSSGHQPMQSRSERYVIVYNGEIYNYRSLARELSVDDQAGSDTIVLLAAIERWGLAAAIERFVGMFAFAVWDRKQQTLSLVRDRLGIKPLYFSLSGRRLLFASELQALRGHPDFSPTIDPDSLNHFFRHKYFNAPRTIYADVQQLPPGAIFSWRPDAADAGSMESYWSVASAIEAGVQEPFTGNLDSAVDELERILGEAVRQRMVCGRACGCVSLRWHRLFHRCGVNAGGVGPPVRTFSIGFHEEKYNEAEYAKAVAHHIGTEHTELYVTSEDALNVVPELPKMFAEPFADVSQIPTYLVSQLTKSAVTVSLSGDGGDELFAGYPRYALCERNWKQLQRVPAPLRSAAAGLIDSLPASAWDSLLQPTSWLPSGSSLHRISGRRFQHLARLAASKSPMDLFDAVQSKWDAGPDVVVGASQPGKPLAFTHPQLTALRDQMMYVDQTTYLPGDILTKLDRASMAVSLEARVPLLDHRVVEFAWRLPLAFKTGELSGGQQPKLVLRRLLARYVPEALTERPKKGFGVPLADWLRGPLRSWADDLLSDSRLRSEALLDVDQVTRMWREHRSGTHNWSASLWTALMFEAWFEAQQGAKGGETA